MKKLFLTLLFIFLFSNAYAFNPLIVTSGVPVAGGDECDSTLVCQNFEGTGYDNSETWDGTNDNEDYAGASVIRGSQSLELTYDAGIPSAGTNFTADDELWVHFIINQVTFTLLLLLWFLFMNHLPNQRIFFI